MIVLRDFGRSMLRASQICQPVASRVSSLEQEMRMPFAGGQVTRLWMLMT